jgi:FKBP-type peptidyl-prolyl cis-trans isomerase
MFRLTGVPVSVLRSLRSLVALAALGLLPVTVAGCTDSPTTPSGFAPFSRTDLRVGTGTTAVNGSVVTVTYTGWLYDSSKTDNKGLQFDSSVGRTPFTFTLGAGQVIAGWELGVPGMNVGGLRRLVIPPNLAYGQPRNDIIPPNATLIFEIELLEAQ